MSDNSVTKVKCNCHGASGVYGVAFIGALIYYLERADTLWMGVVGVVKAIFWPAVILYKVLVLLG